MPDLLLWQQHRGCVCASVVQNSCGATSDSCVDRRLDGGIVIMYENQGVIAQLFSSSLSNVASVLKWVGDQV